MDEGSAPATKADLTELKAELSSDLTPAIDRVLEMMRDIETHLLTEFHR